MSKIAFVFPGQGAQCVGMGQSLYEACPESKEVFDLASDALGYDMAALCFEGPEESLRITENTQPTILTSSVAAYVALKSKGILPDVVAGLSLGEYTALVASGALKFEDAVRLVRTRGKLMQEEVPDGVGGMAAILGLEDNLVEEACKRASAYGVVQAANYNCPLQLVIAGEIAAVEKAVEEAKALGAKKAVMLPVSAPFHTSLLKGAGDKLVAYLDEVTIHPLNIPVIANVNADYYEDERVVKDRLVDQVSHPVLWAKTVSKMVEDGVDIFIEVGPGQSLSKFIKKIAKDVTVMSVEDIESLEKVVEAIKERQV
jgi:[acyl-carrier-protein] S-malonyltransferase